MADADGSSESMWLHTPVPSSAVSDAVDLEAQQQEVQSPLDMATPRPSLSVTYLFDGDDLVVEIVGELVEESMAYSLEAFYECKLPGYAAQCAASAVFDAVSALLETPCAKCERIVHGDNERQLQGNDPVMQVLCRPPSALAEPQPNALDPFCFYGVPLKSPEQPAAAILSQLYDTSSIPVGVKLQHGSGAAASGSVSNHGDRRSSRSRPSSQSSSFRVRKAAPTPPTVPVSPRTAAIATQATTSGITSEYHAPGVVYSTAPPPRVSPRKAMTIFKNAHRISGTAPSIPNHSGAGGERDVSGTSTEDNESDASASDAVPLDDGTRGSKHGYRRDSNGYTSAWGSHTIHDEDEGDLETTERPVMEENAPVQVEFAIKRDVSERHRSSSKSALQQHQFLPELSPQLRLSRNATPPLYPLSELKPDGGLLLTMDQDSKRLGLNHDADSKHFSKDPASLQSPLKSLVLAPGVKLQSGEETKAGPELPLFPTRMRKATFYQDDAIALTLAASMQSLISCASVSSRNLHPSTLAASHSQHHPGYTFSEHSEASLSNLDDGVRERNETNSISADVFCRDSQHHQYQHHQSSNPHLHSHHSRAVKQPASPSESTSSSWTSTTSSMLFKRTSKVQRPCTASSTASESCHGLCSAAPTTAVSPRDGAPPQQQLNNTTLDFKDLAKQRAFIRKASFVATAASPQHRNLSIRVKDRERRLNTAIATGGGGVPPTSPLARRSLHVSKATSKQTPLANATRIL